MPQIMHFIINARISFHEFSILSTPADLESQRLVEVIEINLFFVYNLMEEMFLSVGEREKKSEPNHFQLFASRIERVSF